MKKLLALFLMMTMLVLASATVFAENGGFYESASRPGPEIVEGENEDEDCEADLIITSWADRFNLPEDIRLKMEEAYASILNCTDLTKLCEDLAKLAKKLKIPASNLAVSDLFDISYINCGTHDEHGYFDIVLKAETLNKFVALLHLNGEKWELVKDAQVKDLNGEKHLYFSIDDFSPFAIIVNTGEETEDPGKPGDTSNVPAYIIIMTVSALSIAVIAYKSKKKRV